MTNSRAQAVPVNLKERIAAFQQRNVSPGPASPSLATTPTPNSAGLRDKIAKFEKKGGIPVPRGSFGLGAPPLAENGQAKRRGELYGNRIPGAVRASGGPPISRSSSPFESPRSFSLSALEGDDSDISPTDATHNLPSSPSSPSSPASPFLGLTADHTGTRDPASRGTSFATALDIARRAESSVEVSGRHDLRGPSPSPPILTKSTQEETNDAQVHEIPPAIVISSHEISHTLPPAEVISAPEVPTEEPATDDAEVSIRSNAPAGATSVASSTEEPSAPSSPEPVVPTASVVSSSDELIVPDLPTSVVPTPSGDNTVASSAEPTIVEESSIDTSLSQPSLHMDITSLPQEDDYPTETQPISPSNIEIESDKSTQDVTSVASYSAEDEVARAVQQDIDVQAEEPTPIEEAVNIIQPQVPAKVIPHQAQPSAGPFTLANAVFDLGQVVANIHDMFPGQISPLATPPPYIPFYIAPLTQDAPDKDHSSHSLAEPTSGVKTKKSNPDLQIHLSKPEPSAHNEVSNDTITPLSSTMHTDLELPTPPPEQDIFLGVSHTTSGRPMSMIETSPSHLAVAHRITPLTARGIPMFISPGQKDFEHFPPTPEHDETDFGTVSLHKASHSFSHSRTYVGHPQNPESKSSTFSAVVHGKVTELPGLPSSSSTRAFYMPETPQMSRARRSVYGEVPPSPGYGELAALLQEAALLEKTLEKGELPSEIIRQEEPDRQQEAEELELAKRALEEAQRRSEAASQVRAKQSESKSKGSFRKPMLRSKTHKKDPSTDTQNSNPGRAKSVLLPFRPHHGVDSRQSLHAPVPEGTVTPPNIEGETASQTSPKSPRQYFAGLRRLASTSRPSTSSGNNSRQSISVSSEMSSEDSASIPTPPGADTNSLRSESGQTGYWNGTGITWPSLSPKKSPGSISRATSFADKMWHRGRTKSTVSTASAYETIDRITKSAAAKSAAALIPPLDPISFSIEVPTVDLPSPPRELVSPRRSSSLYVASTSQFPPIYSAKPTSPVYTPLPPLPREEPPSLDSVFAAKLTSPVYTPHPASSVIRPEGVPDSQIVDLLFSAKPTSPVYTPHNPTSRFLRQEDSPASSATESVFSSTPGSSVYTSDLPSPATVSEETITRSPIAESLLPSPKDMTRPSSWMSEDSSTSSIPSPFFDSFPSVPNGPVLPAPTSAHQRNFTRPSLPLPTPSFFDPAPLSSTHVGAEFLPSPFLRSATVRSATLPRTSGEHYR